MARRFFENWATSARLWQVGCHGPSPFSHRPGIVPRSACARVRRGAQPDQTGARAHRRLGRGARRQPQAGRRRRRGLRARRAESDVQEARLSARGQPGGSQRAEPGERGLHRGLVRHPSARLRVYGQERHPESEPPHPDGDGHAAQARRRAALHLRARQRRHPPLRTHRAGRRRGGGTARPRLSDGGRGVLDGTGRIVRAPASRPAHDRAIRARRGSARSRAQRLSRREPER